MTRIDQVRQLPTPATAAARWEEFRILAERAQADPELPSRDPAFDAELRRANLAFVEAFAGMRS